MIIMTIITIMFIDDYDDDDDDVLLEETLSSIEYASEESQYLFSVSWLWNETDPPVITNWHWEIPNKNG